MASAYTIAFLATFLVLQPMTSKGNILYPILSPVADVVCNKVECGKGTCKPSPNSTFLFECECHPGWKQTHSDHDDGFKFLPCVIPNCTLDYSCAEAAPPVQDHESGSTESFFDPCRWTDCGGGTCNKTSPFTYICKCREGYYNLLTVSNFPCFKECALGMDCLTLGISTTNKSTSPPSPADNSKNQGEIARSKLCSRPF
ncbi:hypothetical protein F0562_000363 [Nyssa sinensis]|uniref:EGF-like domain-containing protein n=1 Tax=Nyssa sinensis TaxID=561372 RepID=A0A5J5C0D7_9ASTE|nr:hypothetical protein F0562_000363 [Nyssa sinensis]